MYTFCSEYIKQVYMFEGWVKLMRPQMSNQQTMAIIMIVITNVILKIKSLSRHTLYKD